jgi:hypothetical protein
MQPGVGFEVVLVSSHHHKMPQEKHYVYLQGFDIASPERRKKLIRSIQQKERRTIARLLKHYAGNTTSTMSITAHPVAKALRRGD